MIVGEAPGAPAPPDFDLHLDPDHPERSVVVLRGPESLPDEVPPGP